MTSTSRSSVFQLDVRRAARRGRAVAVLSVTIFHRNVPSL